MASLEFRGLPRRNVFYTVCFGNKGWEKKKARVNKSGCEGCRQFVKATIYQRIRDFHFSFRKRQIRGHRLAFLLLRDSNTVQIFKLFRRCEGFFFEVTTTIYYPLYKRNIKCEFMIVQLTLKRCHLWNFHPQKNRKRKRKKKYRVKCNRCNKFIFPNHRNVISNYRKN